MPTDPPECLHRLNQAGWTIGYTAYQGPGGVVWVVSGMNGENQIRAWLDFLALAD